MEHLLYVLDVDDALMNVVETCMIDGEWHTREWLCDVVKNSVNTAEELVVVVRAQAVAYSLLGRQTTKSTSTSFDSTSHTEN